MRPIINLCLSLVDGPPNQSMMESEEFKSMLERQLEELFKDESCVICGNDKERHIDELSCIVCDTSHTKEE